MIVFGMLVGRQTLGKKFINYPRSLSLGVCLRNDKIISWLLTLFRLFPTMLKHKGLGETRYHIFVATKD